MDEGRTRLELAHGSWLAQRDPEKIWGWKSQAGRARARRRAAWLCGQLGLGPGQRVLEVGCGTGLFTEFFLETGAQIVALDLSDDLLSLARARGLREDRVRFLKSDLYEFFPEDPFDAVVGSSVLHHMDISRALAKVWALVRPGGSIGFAEPNLLNPQVFLQKTIPWIKRLAGDAPHETAFSRWRLVERLAASGFEDIRIETRDWVHPWTPRRWLPAMAGMERILERAPLIRELAGSLYLQARRPV